MVKAARNGLAIPLSSHDDFNELSRSPLGQGPPPDRWLGRWRGKESGARDRVRRTRGLLFRESRRRPLSSEKRFIVAIERCSRVWIDDSPEGGLTDQ